MQHSENINDLAAALAKAQGEVTGALKDSANPFFKSRYADLASCWDACRKPLSENGLAIIQSPEVNDQGLTLTTLLTHSTGQWIKNVFRIMPKDDTPQGVGSALTYARRYALTALIGIAQVDDDGNAASGRNGGAYSEPHRPQGDIPKSVPEADVEAAANQMHAALHDGDLEERIRSLKVLDLHDALNKRQEVYIAAADRLSSKDRAAFKTYVSLAKVAEKADAASDPTRRRAF
jgi:hypothetical protein